VAALAEASGTARILVVEDGGKMAGLRRRGLAAEGHSVDVAQDGIRGLKRLKHFLSMPWCSMERRKGMTTCDYRTMVRSFGCLTRLDLMRLSHCAHYGFKVFRKKSEAKAVARNAREVWQNWRRWTPKVSTICRRS
jgi:hypothetical protein